MIVGVGCDVFAVARLERDLRRDPSGLPAQLFTVRETERCGAGPHHGRHYALRFAGKEAVFKALGLTEGDTASFHEVEILDRTGGGHEAVLHGRLQERAGRLGVRRIHLTLAATRELATAFAVAET